MSLIADALRKSESPTGLTPSPRQPRWLLSAVLMGGVGLVLLVFAYLPKGSPSVLPPTAGIKTTLGSSTQHVASPLLRSAINSWRLNGVVRGGSGKSLALISGQVVSEGEQINGIKVVRVTSNQVDLLEGNRVRTLTLEE